jgi:hypothetical protein
MGMQSHTPAKVERPGWDAVAAVAGSGMQADD